MLTMLHSLASRARHSNALSPFEGVFRRIEPIWNSAMGQALKYSGLETRINDDVFCLTYAYGARYQKQRTYEPAIYLPFAASIQPGMTVFDIGAHVGFFALAAAQRVGSSGTVVAFEPSPETARVLQQHVALNHWDDRVSVERSVVSDRDGSITFYTYRESMAASLSKANVEELNPERPEHATSIELPAITLDSYCRQGGLSPNVIKIDVEGAELRVLTGAESLLRSRSDLVIWCEVHPMQMHNLGDSPSDLSAFLATVDYQIEPIAEPGHMGIYPARIARRA